MSRPQRVAVIGICGSGKSTASRRIADALDLPLVHLDREFWKPGWTKPEAEVWTARHAELIAASSWVIDGNFHGTLVQRIARADLVVKLDVPVPIALWRVVTRAIRSRGVARPDMAPGCFERPFSRHAFEFYWYVARFRSNQGAANDRIVMEHAPGRVVVLRSARDLDVLLTELSDEVLARPATVR